jgi:hypothetical protein
MIWYADLGIAFGIYGFIWYLLELKTHWVYSYPAYFLYSSTTVALVMFLPEVPFLAAAAAGVLIQLLLALLLGSDATLVYSGPRPGPVADFIKKEVAVFKDNRGITHKVDLDLIFSR